MGDCSRFPMWDGCRGAAAFSGGGQEQLLPETEKRGSRGLIMQRPSGPPLPWVSSGWQTGYKKIPYLPVYPHFGQQVVSINDPRRSNQGLSIFDPRGKKASPLQRYLRYFNLGMMFDVFRGDFLRSRPNKKNDGK